MTDTDKKPSRKTLLTGLLLLLLTIVGVQAWYMFGMKQQMDAMHNQQAAAQPAIHNPTDTTASFQVITALHAATLPAAAQTQMQQWPHSLFNDDFFTAQPFDAQTWNPYEEIQRMQRDMDRMFNNAFNRFNNSPDFQHLFREGFTTPEMDVREDDEKYTVIINLPGSGKDNVSVNLDGQTLTVKGEQKFEKLDKDSQGNIIFQERRSGAFQRSITLPGPVKQAGMKTDIDNGVLTITIPKDV